MKLSDFRSMVDGKTCHWCDTGLDSYIETYEHNGGWLVEGFQRRQWLFVTCGSCGYQWSLWKLGVPRDIGDATYIKSPTDATRTEGA